jgi:magnesium transporter
MAEAAPGTTTSSPPAAPTASDQVRIVIRSGGQTTETDDLHACHELLQAADARAWIDLTDPSPERVAEIAAKLELHPLVAEDIVERNQRAKIEEVDGDLHIVLFAMRFEGAVTLSEVDCVLGKRFLLTVHDASFDPRRLPHFRTGVAPVLDRGHDYVLYAIADGIVDGYFPVLDSLSDDIDQLEDDVIEKATSWTLQRLFTIKRELMTLRRATSPAREIFNQLTNRQSMWIAADNLIYFRDVYDHLIRVTDEVDNDRELVGGTLDVYLSTINNNLSTIMKRLTGVTVILAGIGAIAGIFGMSEAASAFSGNEPMGFWLVTGVTAGLAVITLLVLRRNDWI